MFTFDVCTRILIDFLVKRIHKTQLIKLLLRSFYFKNESGGFFCWVFFSLSVCNFPVKLTLVLRYRTLGLGKKIIHYVWFLFQENGINLVVFPILINVLPVYRRGLRHVLCHTQSFSFEWNRFTLLCNDSVIMESDVSICCVSEEWNNALACNNWLDNR